MQAYLYQMAGFEALEKLTFVSGKWSERSRRWERVDSPRYNDRLAIRLDAEMLADEYSAFVESILPKKNLALRVLRLRDCTRPNEEGLLL